MNISIFEYWAVRPLAKFGLTGKFWDIHLDTLIYTWAAMLLLFGVSLVGVYFIKRKINIVSLLTEQGVDFFINLTKESMGSTFTYKHFAFIATMFFYTLFCCLIGLFPYLEESTKDLNTTLALAIISFLYVHYQKIKYKGLKGYLKEYIEPFFVLLPLNVIGEIAKVISMSFRLFGNILGGGIIFFIVVEVIRVYKIPFMIFTLVVLASYFIINKFVDLNAHRILKIHLYTFLGLIFSLAWLQMFFGVFEGVVQAFVITMLTITYLAVGIHNEDEVVNQKGTQDVDA
ncbi:MAG: FoF1 ATP synthase subunit a [bacterium]